MNRDEILSKAQNECDEMEQAVLTKSLGISTIIIPVLCLIFILIRIFSSEYMISDLVTITLAQLSISEFYQYIKMKNKFMLIFGIITLAFTIAFFFSFIREVSL